MKYLKQIYFEMHHQKMMIWVSISGTALAIFLIMGLYMTEKLKRVEISPATERERILVGKGVDFIHQNGSTGSTLNIDRETAEILYSNLEGIEKVSFIETFWGSLDISVPKGEALNKNGIRVDDNFWKIYDFKFLSGSPFSPEEVEARSKIVIISEALAKQLFGEIDVAGKKIDIQNIPHTIKGVVKDVNPLLTEIYNDVFLIVENKPSDVFSGLTNVHLLMKDGVKAKDIKKQVENRYKGLNRKYEHEKMELIYHDQPYTAEDLTSGMFGSNNAPPTSRVRTTHTLIFIMLLILPAINLSSMTRSRLQHRISEIGVRRAFGASKISIVGQLFTENFIITLIGGVIGLVFSVLFFFLLCDSFFFIENLVNPMSFTLRDIRGAWLEIFNWHIFFIALGSCLILNILSATVPAWKASGIKPAEAISRAR